MYLTTIRDPVRTAGVFNAMYHDVLWHLALSAILPLHVSPVNPTLVSRADLTPMRCLITKIEDAAATLILPKLANPADPTTICPQGQRLD
jgi:hypothetical protein